MLSINGALAVDLHGQVVADTIDGPPVLRHRRRTRTSSAARPSPRAATRSSACRRPRTVGDRTISRIVAEFPAGTIVTTPRHQVDVVVTEYGAAELRGRPSAQRAQALAEIAHPDFRDELRAIARTR